MTTRIWDNRNLVNSSSDWNLVNTKIKTKRVLGLIRNVSVNLAALIGWLVLLDAVFNHSAVTIEFLLQVSGYGGRTL